MSDANLLDRVNELLSYDPNTGLFVWKVVRGRAVVGSVAGTLKSDGYRQIKIGGKLYRAHRLAWLITTGAMPKEHIDHIDGCRGNNRITNLREATRSENQRNRGEQVNNTSGYKGVYWNKGAQKWHAQIVLNRRNKYLGLFKTPELAHAAYCRAANRLHGDFANTGSV